MFGSSVVDIAIGIVFVYLLISLICSATNEGIATLFNVRGKNLFDGISNLLNDPNFNKLAQKVYCHGLIAAISQEAADTTKENRIPSYIPSSLFSLALLDILHMDGAAALLPDKDVLEVDQKNAQTSYDTAKAASDTADDNVKLTPYDKQSYKNTAMRAKAVLDLANNRMALYEAAHPAPNAATPSVPPANPVANAVTPPAPKKPYSFMGKINQDALLPENIVADISRLRTVASQFPNDLTVPLNSFEQAVAKLDEGHTKASLQVIIQKTKRDVALLKDTEVKAEHYVAALGANVEKWYDDSMLRVGGWYKRWSKKIIVIYAVVLVVGLNVDTIMIAKRLTKDSALRASLVSAAQDATKPGTSGNADSKTSSPGSASSPSPSSPPASNKFSKTANDNDIYSSKNPQVNAILQGATKLSLPIGWDQNVTLNWFPELTDGWGWMSKIMGLLLTVGAVSLGAPFWFDVLSKFINIRGAGTPPNETKKSAPQPEKIKISA